MQRHCTKFKFHKSLWDNTEVILGGFVQKFNCIGNKVMMQQHSHIHKVSRLDCVLNIKQKLKGWSTDKLAQLL